MATPDSISFEVWSQPPDKEGNKDRLIEMAAEFFGHREFTHNGFKHHLTDEYDRSLDEGWLDAPKVPTLYTSVVFYEAAHRSTWQVIP